ncbi:MAG: sulfatase-like hydrolase/transferase [Acidobacteria bacterium]|nr:sulfatase-like hydrolase/transferase [Acidobacteriota bacterium]
MTVLRAAAVLLSLLPAAAVGAQPPNIVLILADDLGWTDLACYGSDYHRTPRTDQLAREGLRFTDAYAACQSCSPTRASILTGRYPARLHLTDWIPGRTPDGSPLSPPDWTNYLRHGEITIAEALAPAGYVSASIGKWHLGKKGWFPQDQGFAVNVLGSAAGSHARMFPPYWPPTQLRTVGLEPLSDVRGDEYLTDRLTREAEAFLEAHRDQPFFLYLSHFAVHARIQGKPELVRRYEARPPGRYHHNPEYAAMLESLDESVGRIVDKLEALGLSERTLVVFYSDNGGLSKGGAITSNRPLRGEKSTAWEGGVRVPLIARWPGVVPPGRETGEPVSSPDLFPTFLEAAGVEPPVEIDGKSLLPLLRGEEFRRGPIFWHAPHYNAHTPVLTMTPYGAVRDGDWKLIERYEDGSIELYNMAEDLGETTDLSAERPEVAARLRGLLADWRGSVGAQTPTANPDADPVRYSDYKENHRWGPVGDYEQRPPEIIPPD